MPDSQMRESLLCIFWQPGIDSRHFDYIFLRAAQGSEQAQSSVWYVMRSEQALSSRVAKSSNPSQAGGASDRTELTFRMTKSRAHGCQRLSRLPVSDFSTGLSEGTKSHRRDRRRASVRSTAVAVYVQAVWSPAVRSSDSESSDESLRQLSPFSPPPAHEDVSLRPAPLCPLFVPG